MSIEAPLQVVRARPKGRGVLRRCKKAASLAPRGAASDMERKLVYKNVRSDSMSEYRVYPLEINPASALAPSDAFSAALSASCIGREAIAA
jgi:hypothetical protein